MGRVGERLAWSSLVRAADMDQPDAAVLLLEQEAGLSSDDVDESLVRLRYAYADALLRLDRTQEATEWFSLVNDQDTERGHRFRGALAGAGQPVIGDRLLSVRGPTCLHRLHAWGPSRSRTPLIARWDTGGCCHHQSPGRDAGDVMRSPL